MKHYKGKMTTSLLKKVMHTSSITHCDALVVKAIMANNNVYKILVDNGSSVDILYYQGFQRMRLKDSDYNARGQKRLGMIAGA